MYIFELTYINPFDVNNELTEKIEIDSTPLEVSELEIFEMAMDKAYSFCKSNEFEFISLSLIAC